jgi:FkbM family methyltransferase
MIDERRVARVSVSGFAPFPLQVHPAGELVSDHLVTHGVWEPFESSLLPQLLRPGGCMLDVGANLGYFSVLGAQLVGGSGRVVAVEPDSENFALLRANTAGLTPVELQGLALGAVPGHVTMSANPANKGDLYPLREADSTVPMLRGDELGLDRVDLLKIDVQGAELAVLQGLRETMARSRPGLAVMIEAWPYGLARFGDSAAALLDELLALALPVAMLDHQAHVLVDLDERALRTLLLEALTVARQGFVNLLLTDRKIQVAGDPTR